MSRRVPFASFARPANTTAYAANDLVANNVTAGSVAPVELQAGKFVGGGGIISGVRLAKSNVSVVNANFRVHFFTAAPSVSGGDNAALAITNGLAKGYIGAVDVTVDRALGDGAVGRTAASMLFDTVKPSSKLYALIEVLAAYTPASAEIFTLSIEVDSDNS